MRIISNKLWIWILFILSPFLSLCIVFKSYRKNIAKNVLWAFVIFYGITFVVSSEGIDSFVYASSLKEMHDRVMTFSEVVAQFYNEEGGNLDFIQPLLTFIVSLFTDNYHILFGVFCVVFGYFYSRNIYLILDKLGGEIRPEVLFFVLVFALIIPMWMINGVRMWTAAHIFCYGTLSYLTNSKKTSLIWCIVAAFMHFSFIFPIAVLGIFIFIGNRTNAYFCFFLISFFLTQWNIGDVGNLMQTYLPSLFQNRVEGYTNADYAQNVGDAVAATNFYIRWYQPLLQYAITSLLIVAYWKGKIFFETNQSYHRLMGFTFLFYSMSNLVYNIPSFGRFQNVASLFGVACIIFYFHYSSRPKLIRRILPFAVATMSLFAIVQIRIGFDTIGVMTIIGNLVTVFFNNTELPLIEFIK